MTVAGARWPAAASHGVALRDVGTQGLVTVNCELSTVDGVGGGWA